MNLLKRLIAVVLAASLATPASAQISGYSTTASSNSTVGGVSVAEGTAPGNLNNAIRAVMADLATYYSGSGTKFTGNGSVTGTWTAGGLLVGDGTAGSPGLRFTSDDNNGFYRASADAIGISTGGTARGVFASDGNFIMGAVSNAGGQRIAAISSGTSVALFRRNTNSGTLVDFNVAGTDVGTISSNGSTTSYNTSSDARLKTNIADAGEAGAILDAVKVRQFDWRSDGSHQRFGFVAQELEPVVPEAVTQGETWSVDYSKLVPLLVKEVQSLRARVAELEAAN